MPLKSNSELRYNEYPEGSEFSEEHAVQLFLTLVHDGCPGQLEVRTIHPETRVVACHWPNNVKEAVLIAIKKCSSENVYFGICTRLGKGTGKKDNLYHFPGIWTDLDFKDFPGGEADVCTALKAFPLQPTLLVHTGGGAHAYWLLTKPLLITPERISHLESLNARFARMLGGDSCHDLARILRIPGTTNWPDEKKRKRGRVPELVRLLWHEGPRYPLVQLQEFMATASGRSYTDHARIARNSPSGGSSLSKRFLELLHTNAKIKATWEGRRKDLKDQSGSGYDMALANLLARYHFSDDDIKGILRHMPSGRGPNAKDAYHDITIKKVRTPAEKYELTSADWADQFLSDRQLQSQDGLALRQYRDSWFKYNGTAYDSVPESDLIADITAYLQSTEARKKVTKSFVNNVLLNLQGFCLVPSHMSLPALEAESNWIESPNTLVMTNGLLDLRDLLTNPQSLALEAHSPKLISTVALPFAFDPHADCPRWNGFLRRILPDLASQQLLKQIFGYCLTNDISHQRFFLFEGTGANGKGVVTNVLIRMLGQANVSSLPLELFAAAHGLEVTLGKLVNIVSEVGELDRIAEGYLKQFTGADLMHFNPKFKNPFSAKPTAKLIITTNVRPPFRDRSEGIWRRLILLPFPISIPETEQNQHLAEELAEELPGIFNWAVNGYKSLRARGYFIEPSVCQNAKREFRSECNPAWTFLQEQCGLDPNAETLTGELYFEYDSFCKSHGYKPLNDSNFGKEVRRVFPQVTKGKLSRTADSHRPPVYRGLCILKKANAPGMP